MKKMYLKVFAILAVTGTMMIFSPVSALGGIDLPKLVIPAAPDYVFTPPFKIVKPGELKIIVKIKTTVAGNAGYRIDLLRDRTLLQSRNVSAIPFNKTVELKYTLAGCSQTGLFKIRIKNISSSNPKPGEAVFPTFNQPNSSVECRRTPRFANQRMDVFSQDKIFSQIFFRNFS